MPDLIVKVVKLRADAFLPVRATDQAAGYDLFCVEKTTILPGKVELVKTGLSLEIPDGYEGQIRPRSGLSTRHKIFVPNAPGTIDADYRGEVMVALYNASKNVFELGIKDRIAQLIIKPILSIDFQEVKALTKTTRGKGGFGSTGK